jgi:hypothetical protein
MKRYLWKHLLIKLYHLLVLYSVILVLDLMPTESLRFHLPPNTKRCLKEEMRKDVLVTGQYDLSDAPGQRTDLSVHYINSYIAKHYYYSHKYLFI